MPVNGSMNIQASQQRTDQKNTSTFGSNSLGQDAFLKILITQLQNQDPLSPMEDKDFIAQLAQFSTLEQLQTIGGMVEHFLAIQSEDSFLGYAELIGKNVQYEKKNEDGEMEKLDGKVKSVSFKDGQIMVELENGESIPSYVILTISDGSNETTPEPEPEPEPDNETE